MPSYGRCSRTAAAVAATAALIVGKSAVLAAESEVNAEALEGLTRLLRRESSQGQNVAADSNSKKLVDTKLHDAQATQKVDSSSSAKSAALMEELAQYVTTGHMPTPAEESAAISLNSRKEEMAKMAQDPVMKDMMASLLQSPETESAAQGGNAKEATEEEDEGSGNEEADAKHRTHIESRKSDLVDSIKRLLENAADQDQAMSDVRRIFDGAKESAKLSSDQIDAADLLETAVKLAKEEERASPSKEWKESSEASDEEPEGDQQEENEGDSGAASLFQLGERDEEGELVQDDSEQDDDEERGDHKVEMRDREQHEGEGDGDGDGEGNQEGSKKDDGDDSDKGSDEDSGKAGFLEERNEGEAAEEAEEADQPETPEERAEREAKHLERKPAGKAAHIRKHHGKEDSGERSERSESSESSDSSQEEVHQEEEKKPEAAHKGEDSNKDSQKEESPNNADKKEEGGALNEEAMLRLKHVMQLLKDPSVHADASKVAQQATGTEADAGAIGDMAQHKDADLGSASEQLQQMPSMQMFAGNPQAMQLLSQALNVVQAHGLNSAANTRRTQAQVRRKTKRAITHLAQVAKLVQDPGVLAELLKVVSKAGTSMMQGSKMALFQESTSDEDDEIQDEE